MARAAGFAGFPAALMVVALLWLGGATGRVTDDYQLNMRDPATGALPSPFDPWHRYPFFWRPLHTVTCFTIGTLLSDCWPAVMVLCAALYAGMGVCVFVLLRRATDRAGPAAAGALLWLLFPMNYEVPFWLSAAAVSISIALWCIASVWAIRLALRTAPLRAREVLGFAAVSFAIPCFYEQPATGAAALPVMILAAWLGARRRGATVPPLRTIGTRAVLFTCTSLLAAAGYAALLRATAPPTFRGGSGSLAPLAQLPARTQAVADSVWWHLFGARGTQTISGAWELGAETLAGPAGIAALLALAGLAVLWAVAWRQDLGTARTPDAASEEPRQSRAAGLLWCAAGAAILLGGFVPVALVDRQNVEPRTLLFPLLGAALALAVVLDRVLAAVRAHRAAPAARFGAGLATAAAAIACTICFVGIQAWHADRSRLDEHAAAELAALARDVQPGTVLIPVRIADRPTSTGRPLFDRLRLSAFSTPWSATGLMRQAMGRSDIHCIAHHPWTGSPLTSIDETGLMCAYELNSRADNPGAGAWIPWPLAAPFSISDRGRVCRIAHMVVERPDDRVHRLSPEELGDAISRGQSAAHGCGAVVRLRGNPLPALGEWTWCADGARVVFAPVNLLEVRREAVKLTGGTGGAHAAMEVALPAQPSPRRLNLRACVPVPPHAWPADAPMAVLLVSIRDGTRTILEHRVEVGRDPGPVPAAWDDASIDIPASGTPLQLVVEAIGTARTPRPVVWVTPGRWSAH